MYILDVYGHSQTALHLWKSESFKKLVLYIQSTTLSVLGGPNPARAEHFCCPNLNFKRLKILRLRKDMNQIDSSKIIQQ